MKVFRLVWRRWLSIARKIGEFQGRVILTIFYFLFVGPFALAVKLFSDPLGLKANPKDSYWIGRETKKAELEDAKKQF